MVWYFLHGTQVLAVLKGGGHKKVPPFETVGSTKSISLDISSR